MPELLERQGRIKQESLNLFTSVKRETFSFPALLERGKVEAEVKVEEVKQKTTRKPKAEKMETVVKGRPTIKGAKIL